MTWKDIAAAGRLFPFGVRRPVLAGLGPALVASIAYVDPGNIATNIEAGARHGLHLISVVLFANVVAMLFQGLAAKLGIVTGQNLAELSRDHFPRPVAHAMWGVSELAAIATDLAELLGGAIGFALLLHVSLLDGMAICALAAYGILLLQRRGARPIELAAGGFLVFIGVSYAAQIAIAGPGWHLGPPGLLLPALASHDSITLAVALVGATVMPHAIYLHSALTQHRSAPRDDERRRLIRRSNGGVILALGAAGLVNLAMVALAAIAFHDGVHDNSADIASAYRMLRQLLGGGAATLFLASLIGSGLTSSAVGTMAGQIIMQGFTRVRIPLWVRRLATILPAFAVVALDRDVTGVMVLSQVALSLALPVPVIALLILSRRRAVMGDFVTGPWTGAAALSAAALVIGLNLVLVLSLAGVPLPLLAGA